MTILDFTNCKTAEDVKKVYNEGTPIPGARYLRQKLCSHIRVEDGKKGYLHCKDCDADIPKLSGVSLEDKK